MISNYEIFPLFRFQKKGSQTGGIPVSNSHKVLKCNHCNPTCINFIIQIDRMVINKLCICMCRVYYNRLNISSIICNAL